MTAEERGELLKFLDRILDCPYDLRRWASCAEQDATEQAKREQFQREEEWLFERKRELEREREQFERDRDPIDREQEPEWDRIHDFWNEMQHLFDRPLIVLPGGLKAKVEDIRACRYADLKQNLEDVLDVLITLRWERDLERDAAFVDR